jgi:hypothetical protein
MSAAKRQVSAFLRLIAERIYEATLRRALRTIERFA